MLAAVHLENLLFLLFIFVAFLFQVLTRAASKANKGPGQPTGTKPRPTITTLPRARPETDEERIRKFLEALGQPAGSTPPPPVTTRKMDAAREAAEARHRLEQERRAAQQPAKTFRIPQGGLPPLTTFPPALPREVKPARQPSASGQGKVYQPQAKETPIFEVHDVAPSSEPLASVKAAEQLGAVQPDAAGPRLERDFVALLKSPSGLRNAIILREIFGPPRSMQPLELV